MSEENIRSYTGNLKWLFLCAIAGALVSALPNLIFALRGGSPVWIADNDEIMYACLTSQAYLQHPWQLSDPALLHGQGSVAFPWIVFAPGILLARALHMGPGGIMFLLRLWGGATLGIGWYLLLGEFLRKRLLIACLSVFFLFDAGILGCRPILRPLVISARLVQGQAQELLAANPKIHPEWRIMTPVLNLGIALLYFFLMQRARRNPSSKAWIGAGVTLGLLIWSFFYFWTACICALIVCLFIDHEHRRLYAKVASLGILIGSPSLFFSYLLKHTTAPDWLWRNDHFLPVARFAPVGVSRLAVLVVIAAFFFVWSYRKDLLYLWAVSFSGLALNYSSFVTGLEMEGFHWQYLWAYTLTLVVLLLLIGFLERSKYSNRIHWAIVVLAVVELGIGFWLRAIEAIRSRESVEFTAAYHQVEDQLHSQTVLQQYAVLAGDREFVDFAPLVGAYYPLSHYVLAYSPATTDRDLDEREVLNAFLLGVPRDDFIGQKRMYLEGTDVRGRERRDPAARQARLQGFGAIFDEIAMDPASAIRKYRVQYLAVRNSPAWQPRVDRYWKPIQSGEWQIWERSASDNMNASAVVVPSSHTELSASTKR